MEIERHYSSIEMGVKKYVFLILIPCFIVAIAIPILIGYLESSTFLSIPWYATYLIPISIILVALTLPLILGVAKKAEIERYLHLFITRMCMLSTAKMPPELILKHMSEVEEYGALRDEIKKIYNLVRYWNRSISEATRFVSTRTPSLLLADFLDRMAHSIEAGEDFQEFLDKERKVTVDAYVLRYGRSIKMLELVREAFVSTVVSAMFIMIFVSLLPMFMPMESDLYLILSTFLVVAIEGLILYYMYIILPHDFIWHEHELRPSKERNIKFVTGMMLVVSVVLFLNIYNLFDMNLLVIVSIASVPLLYPGYAVSKQETLIKKRDENYEAFIRAVGSYAKASEVGVEKGIRSLREHDFGELGENVNSMYNRMIVGIDTKRSWKYFAVETGSNLISKFTDMFIEGIGYGGKIDEMLTILSENYEKMLGARKDRYQMADNFVGILYGLSVGVTFTLYVSLNLMQLMNYMLGVAEMGETETMSMPLLNASFNLELASIMFPMVIVVHCAISAGMLRFVKGSHAVYMFLHFVAMLWLCAVTGVLCDKVVGYLMFT